jgi:sec-independent protein translocase protein TatB
MFGLGFQEVIVILVVALIVIGPKKLPELAKVLGKALRELRRATDDIKQNFDMDPIDLKPKSDITSILSPVKKVKKNSEVTDDTKPLDDSEIKSNGG